MFLIILSSGRFFKKAVEKDICTLQFIPYHLNTRETCEKEVEKYPWLSKYIPDFCKTKGMCIRAVFKIPCLLEYIPLSVQEQFRSCDDDDKLIEW